MLWFIWWSNKRIGRIHGMVDGECFAVERRRERLVSPPNPRIRAPAPTPIVTRVCARAQPPTYTLSAHLHGPSCSRDHIRRGGSVSKM